MKKNKLTWLDKRSATQDQFEFSRDSLGDELKKSVSFDKINLSVHRLRQKWIGPTVIAGSLMIWALFMWIAARSVQLQPLDNSTWGRWDTGWYRTIAEEGYSFGRCIDVPNRSIDDYCGAAGWFPGFPYLNRIIGLSTGISVDSAGRWVAFVGFIITLTVLWYGFLAYRPVKQGVLAMTLVAVFPSSVYFGAIFPISIVTASVVSALALIERQKFFAAGLVGAIGAFSYPSGVMIAAAAFGPLTMTGFGSNSVRIRAVLSVSLPVFAGYVLVLLNFERTVGRWDAWFRIQEAYGYGFTWPLATIRKQIGTILSGDIPRWIGVQTVFMMVLITLGILIVYRNFRTLTMSEIASFAIMVSFWLPPLVLGGDLSLYRAESLLVPAVILVSRLHRYWIFALTAAAGAISFNMAQLFFAYILI